MTKANLRKLRDYQNRINDAVKVFLLSDQQRGQVYSPTGSGKTECFGHTVYDLPTLLKSLQRQKLRVLVVHPRIALSQEQLKRFKDMFGASFRFMSLHSGGHQLGKERQREKSTLDFEDIKKDIEACDNAMHITFTSYDSLNKVGDYPFDLVICDEAHNLATESMAAVVAKLGASKILFYTATPIISDLEEDEGFGMNCEVLFGKVIIAIEPIELIKKGYIVPPVIHFMDVATNQRGEGVDTTQCVAAAYIYQREEMKRHGMPFVQMLVASRGYKDHEKIERELVDLWKAIGEDVPVFVIEAGESRRNGIAFKNRFETLEEIKNSDKSCIVMHYDTLAEGIDINSLTGACILRHMKKAKLLQTIGRCGRPYSKDLDSNYEPVEFAKRLKPGSVITFPIIDGQHVGGIDAGRIVEAFIAGGYGDLTTYLDPVTKKTMSATQNQLDLGETVTDPTMQQIVGANVRREVSLLEEYGFVL